MRTNISATLVLLLGTLVSGCGVVNDGGNVSEEDVGTVAEALCTSALAIDGVLGTAAPGHGVILSGCAFGANPGSVWLLFPEDGTAAPLVVNTWNTTSIGVTIPGGLVGVHDQDVRYKVMRADGAKVLSAPRPFTATRQTITLDLADFASTCDDHGNIDSTCVGAGDFFIGNQICPAGICVQHKQNAFPAPLSFGDRFRVSLEPGWVYTSHVLFTKDAGADLPWLWCPNGGVGPDPAMDYVDSDTRDLDLQVGNWLTGCGSWDRYYLNVKVTGPKGTLSHR